MLLTLNWNLDRQEETDLINGKRWVERNMRGR